MMKNESHDETVGLQGPRFAKTVNDQALGIRRFLAAQAARFAQFFRVLTIS
jgi:hypothetical protein